MQRSNGRRRVASELCFDFLAVFEHAAGILSASETGRRGKKKPQVLPAAFCFTASPDCSGLSIGGHLPLDASTAAWAAARRAIGMRRGEQLT